MVDNTRLGGFKTERISLGAVFTAPKQYIMLSKEGQGKTTLMVKGKGVKKDALKNEPFKIVKQQASFFELNNFVSTVVYDKLIDDIGTLYYEYMDQDNRISLKSTMKNFSKILDIFMEQLL
jgi:hypothetical protein